MKRGGLKKERIRGFCRYVFSLFVGSFDAKRADLINSDLSFAFAANMVA